MCQQKSEAETRERQKGNRGNRQNGDWTEPKEWTKWVSGMRKAWETQKQESCNEIAREVVRTVGKVAPSFSIVIKASGAAEWEECMGSGLL